MIVTNKYLGIPVFFLILFLMFIVTFGPIGEGLKGWVEMLINDVLAENLLAALASMSVAPWALDLVNTVIGGVCLLYTSRAVGQRRDACETSAVN